MSQYIVLIYEDPTYYETMPPEGWAGVVEAHGTFAAKVAELGATITGGGSLAPVTTATKIVGGTVTDGPFVESKEAFLGYYTIEARDLAQAIEIGKLAPQGGGGVEVRPLQNPDPEANPF